MECSSDINMDSEIADEYNPLKTIKSTSFHGQEQSNEPHSLSRGKRNISDNPGDLRKILESEQPAVWLQRLKQPITKRRKNKSMIWKQGCTSLTRYHLKRENNDKVKDGINVVSEMTEEYHPPQATEGTSFHGQEQSNQPHAVSRGKRNLSEIPDMEAFQTYKERKGKMQLLS